MKYKVIPIFISILLLSAVLSFAGVAKISELEGEVIYSSFDTENWMPAKLGQELNIGDKIKTAEASKVNILFHSGHSAELAGNSELVINLTGRLKTNLDLFKGKLRSKVKKLSGEQAYIIKTPQSVCAVRGTDFGVSIVDNMTIVEVYEGMVEAMELLTGKTVDIPAGYMSGIRPNSAPAAVPTGTEDLDSYKTESGKSGSEDKSLDLKEEARIEMFEEISRDAVLARVSDEIKRAEYENGKALVDAHGNRVRLEEYIVRPEKNQFKYVVLNTRNERFDFGKILFSFDKDLPDDLTDATKTMFKSDNTIKPDWILTDLTSVISNTKDRVNEAASGGDMVPDDIDTPTSWTHYFSDYTFSIKGYDRDQVDLWSYTASNITEFSDIAVKTDYTYLGGSEPTSVYEKPAGEDVLHLRIKDTYADTDETWIAVDDYLLDDDGNVISSNELKNNFNTDVGKTLNDYLAQLNFERKYTSSEFSDRDIDLVFSTKLLLDSGILTISLEE